MKKVFLILLILMIVTGCKSTDKEDAINEEQKIYSAGISMAKNYIRNKYTFELLDNDIYNVNYQVNGCSAGSIPINCNKKTGKVFFYSKYNGLDYKILVDTNTGNCSDNYEKNVYKEKYINYFSNTLNIGVDDFTIIFASDHQDSFLANSKITNDNFLLFKDDIIFFTYKNIDEAAIDLIVKNIGNVRYDSRSSLEFLQVYDYNDYIFLKNQNESLYGYSLSFNRENKYLVKEYYYYLTNTDNNSKNHISYNRIKLANNSYALYETNDNINAINITKMTNAKLKQEIQKLKNDCSICYTDNEFLDGYKVNVSNYCDNPSDSLHNYCNIIIYNRPYDNVIVLGGIASLPYVFPQYENTYKTISLKSKDTGIIFMK